MVSHSAGQMAPSAVVVVLLLIVVAGVLVDGLYLLTVRHGAYRVAADAALQGVRAGTDYWHYITQGEMRLNPAVAVNQAMDVVDAGVAPWGLEGHTVQVEVLADPDGGTIANFPPYPSAQQQGGTTWQEDRPAVGVYVQADVPAFFLGWFNGNMPITVHAFGASLVETESAALP